MRHNSAWPWSVVCVLHRISAWVNTGQCLQCKVCATWLILPHRVVRKVQDPPPPGGPRLARRSSWRNGHRAAVDGCAASCWSLPPHCALHRSRFAEGGWTRRPGHRGEPFDAAGHRVPAGGGDGPHPCHAVHKASLRRRLCRPDSFLKSLPAGTS